MPSPGEIGSTGTVAHCVELMPDTVSVLRTIKEKLPPEMQPPFRIAEAAVGTGYPATVTLWAKPAGTENGGIDLPLGKYERKNGTVKVDVKTASLDSYAADAGINGTLDFLLVDTVRTALRRRRGRGAACRRLAARVA